MNSFSGQGKALPVEIRNITVGKWLHNKGIASTANIIQYLIQYLVRYFSTLVRYFSTLVQYFSTLVGYFSWVLQYLIHQHANFALQVLTHSKFGNVIRNIQNKLGKRALKSDLKSTVTRTGQHWK